MSTQSELQAIGRVIREQRHFLGMSQIEFAAFFNASPTTIYRIENGRDCRLSTLIKICDRLDLMLSELVEMAEEEMK